MDEREKPIVEAAIRVIMRYGVKRTTMNDIAGEAGIVRQTLYNVFQNKEDVLRATIRYVTETSINEIRAGWQRVTALCNGSGMYQVNNGYLKHARYGTFRRFEINRVRANRRVWRFRGGMVPVAFRGGHVH